MRRLLLLSLLLLAVGCAPKGARKDYLQVYDRYTKHLVIYHEFETALNLRATYLSDEFRKEMADERERLLGEAAAEDDVFLRDLLSDGEVYHEVVFSADSGMDEGERFGATDAGWHLELHADGTSEKLVTVYKVRTPNPMQRALYPHFNVWSDLWVARFDKTVKRPSKVELFVGSGYGHGQLTWDLR